MTCRSGLGPSAHKTLTVLCGRRRGHIRDGPWPWLVTPDAVNLGPGGPRRGLRSHGATEQTPVPTKYRRGSPRACRRRRRRGLVLVGSVGRPWWRHPVRAGGRRSPRPWQRPSRTIRKYSGRTAPRRPGTQPESQPRDVGVTVAGVVVIGRGWRHRPMCTRPRPERACLPIFSPPGPLKFPTPRIVVPP